MDATYTLRFSDTVLLHGPRRHHLLHDIPDDVVMEALVASGDCLEMLASDLDIISSELPAGSTEQRQIERTIRTLLYLQRKYRIVKKEPGGV